MFETVNKHGITMLNYFTKTQNRKVREIEGKKLKLKKEIAKVKNDFDIAFNNFNYTDNPAMAECLIFHMKSLESQYENLLREAKILYEDDWQNN